MIFGLFGGDKKRAAEFIAATKLGDKEKVRQMLAKGADVNAVDPSSGNTVLITAVDSGQAAVVDLLLEHRPNLDLKDNNGRTALFVAASKGNAASSILDVLFKAGANSRLGPTDGQNAGGTHLHLASTLGANEAVRCLLSHKAPTDVRLPDGSTLMHSAAIGSDSTTIKILCDAGVSIDNSNIAGRTPLHYAAIVGNDVAAARRSITPSPAGRPSAPCRPPAGCIRCWFACAMTRRPGRSIPAFRKSLSAASLMTPRARRGERSYRPQPSSAVKSGPRRPRARSL